MGVENAQCPNCLLKNEIRNENKKLSGKNYSNKDIQKNFRCKNNNFRNYRSG